MPAITAHRWPVLWQASPAPPGHFPAGVETGYKNGVVVSVRDDDKEVQTFLKPSNDHPAVLQVEYKDQPSDFGEEGEVGGEAEAGAGAGGEAGAGGKELTKILTIWSWPKCSTNPSPAIVLTWETKLLMSPTGGGRKPNEWKDLGFDLFSPTTFSKQAADLANDLKEGFAVIPVNDSNASLKNILSPSRWIGLVNDSQDDLHSVASNARSSTASHAQSTGRGGGGDPMDDTVESDQHGEISFVNIDYETYVIKTTMVKGEPQEHKIKILTCIVSNFNGMYRICCERERSECVYELFITMVVNPKGSFNTKTILDPNCINDKDLANYKLVKIPITLRQSDLKSITTLAEKMGKFWPPLGLVFKKAFTIDLFRDLLTTKAKTFLRDKRILRAIDNFGRQYGTEHKLQQGLFVFANCVIDAGSGETMTHEDAGYKMMEEIFSESQLSPNFYPWICPVKNDMIRLRVFRTLISLAKNFTGINYEAFMVTMASYFCAPKFEYIQREMFGVFIKVLTSSEGSTGKTEM